MVRQKTTGDYMNAFDEGTQESRLTQAYKSLELHMTNATKDKELVLDYHNNYKKQLELAGKETPELSLCKKDNKHFTFPTRYAKLLAGEKELQIIKALK